MRWPQSWRSWLRRALMGCPSLPGLTRTHGTTNFTALLSHVKPRARLRALPLTFVQDDGALLLTDAEVETQDCKRGPFQEGWHHGVEEVSLSPGSLPRGTGAGIIMLMYNRHCL
ncbi:hypothetical protein AAFF_G00101890 [Aldrovandia affinis]|uniref:Uncharacterized protein n=1 Tax=Aldrovandia affinis TaxID=143900 RepID=A0AAD7WBH8_9TELE|nr:hypothetical protein AAFF_G00101890 [Aldrovandia affinis]